MSPLGSIKKWLDNRTSRKSPINPEEGTYQLGQKCKKCNQSIKPHIAITLCKCQKYCHYHCFLDNVQEEVLKSKHEIKCQKCGETINFSYQTNHQFQPHCEVIYGFMLILAILMIVASLSLLVLTFIDLSNTVQQITDNQAAKIVGCLLIFIIGILFGKTSMTKLLWIKQIRIKNVKSSGLAIQIQDFELVLQAESEPSSQLNQIDQTHAITDKQNHFENISM